MKYAISVDPGKFETKCSGRNILELFDRTNKFATKYYDLKDGDVEVEGNSSLVEYEGKSLIIGDQGEIYDDSTSKTSLLHKLAIYKAIASIVKDDTNPKVILTIGCPTVIFKSKEKKEEYRELIKTNPTVRIDGKVYRFIFERLIIKCEGSGIVYLEPEVFRNKRTAILDIGGRNLNFGVYENRAPVPSTLFSNNNGGIILETLAKESLDSHYGMDFDLTTVRKAIREDGIQFHDILSQESKLLIKEIKRRYVKQYILSPIAKKNISLKFTVVVAVGGTSISVIDALKEEIPHITQPKAYDPQWVNVNGFQTVCKVKAGIL